MTVAWNENMCEINASQPDGETGLNAAFAAYHAHPGEREMECLIQAATRLINHFMGMFPATFAREDLYQTAVIGLLKAAHSYSAQHGTVFSTWASSCILGELRHYARVEYRQTAIPMDEIEGQNASQAEAVDAHADLLRAVSRLSPLEQQVLRALYSNGLTQEETARALGLHQRKVSRVKLRALTLLRQLLSQPNFKMDDEAPSFHLYKRTQSKNG